MWQLDHSFTKSSFDESEQPDSKNDHVESNLHGGRFIAAQGHCVATDDAFGQQQSGPIPPAELQSAFTPGLVATSLITSREEPLRQPRANCAGHLVAPVA